MQPLGAKIYTTHIGLRGTRKELEEIFDKYTINEFNEFYFSIMDEELKAALKGYFLIRMLQHGGATK